MESQNGEIVANLERALGFVEKAADEGAELIALPEFMPTGYIFTTAIWDGGEPGEGPTVEWLREHSGRLGVYLGTSFLEAEGEEFFNTFVLCAPDGREVGRVRKQTPAGFENYFTRGDTGPHYLDTELGRIGVGICYENILSYTPGLMKSNSVDLMLMPHSAPTPTQGVFFPRKAVDVFNDSLRTVAKHYADLLGIPTVMINKSGKWNTTLPGLPFFPQRSTFPGLSTIVDSDGEIKAQLGAEEGVIVENVILDPARKTDAEPSCRGRWAMDVPWTANLFRVVEAIGGAWYNLSSERKKRAREISSGK
jgi:N-carbamoylputrescine amidase